MCFRDIFKFMVHKKDKITYLERFLYLPLCLKYEAASAIQASETSEQKSSWLYKASWLYKDHLIDMQFTFKYAEFTFIANLETEKTPKTRHFWIEESEKEKYYIGNTTCDSDGR